MYVHACVYVCVGVNVCVYVCVCDTVVTADYNITHETDHMTAVSDLSPLCEHQSGQPHTPEAGGRPLAVPLSLCERSLKALDLIAETVGSRSPRPWVILIDVVRFINIVDGGAI